MIHRAMLAVLLSLLLAGCMSVNTVVRDPKTGQTEKCTATFNALLMNTRTGKGMTVKGRCTDGSTMEVKTVDGKLSPIARDRFGSVGTCGPEFNVAMCWPSAEHYKPAPAGPAGWELHE